VLPSVVLVSLNSEKRRDFLLLWDLVQNLCKKCISPLFLCLLQSLMKLFIVFLFLLIFHCNFMSGLLSNYTLLLFLSVYPMFSIRVVFFSFYVLFLIKGFLVEYNLFFCVNLA